MYFSFYGQGTIEAGGGQRLSIIHVRSLLDYSPPPDQTQKNALRIQCATRELFGLFASSGELAAEF